MHEKYMALAIEEAKKSAALDEVPVGAIIVKNGEIIASQGNRRETDCDATAHAETAAIREASKRLGGWNLHGCTMYVTLEPCIMCTGAIINSRIEKVVFGAFDTRFGAMGSVLDITKLELNHKPEIISGIMADECSSLLKTFFKEKRERGKRWTK